MKKKHIQTMLQEAVGLHQAGNIIEAERRYRDVLLARPNDPDALNLLGMLLLQKGDIDTAEKMVGRAVAIDQNAPMFRVNLGNILRDKGSVVRAIYEYLTALKLEPRFALAHYNLANALQLSRNFPEAVKHYRTAIQLSPQFPEAYYNLAQAYEHAGSIDEAISAYGSAIRLNPAFTDAYFNLGLLYEEMRMSDNALECYRKTVDLSPGFVKAFHNIGNLLRERGDIAGAEDAFRNALKGQSDYPEAWAGLGLILRERGLISEAIQAAERSVALRKDIYEQKRQHQKDSEFSWQEQESAVPGEAELTEQEKYRKAWNLHDRVYAQHSPGLKLSEQLDFLGFFKTQGVRTVLDAGIGSGKLGRRMLSMGFDCHGIDIADNCLDADLAVMKDKLLTVGVLWNQGLFGENAFDAVVCTDVLEHIPTERIDDVLENFRVWARRYVFLQIALFDDEFGRSIGEPLHLTVKPMEWWDSKLSAFKTLLRTPLNDKKGNLMYAVYLLEKT